MPIEQAMPGRLARWISAAEPDWDAVYADQLPRVYNFFRYRFGVTADAEDLTARTFEKAWRARHRYRRDQHRAERRGRPLMVWWAAAFMLATLILAVRSFSTRQL